jgi:hypothetical protein
MTMATMSSSIAFYEQLLAAENDRERARIIAEGFERLEDRYPELRDLATATQLTETRLQLESQIKIEVETCRSELKGDIEACRSELKGDIETCRSELKGDIEACRSELRGEVGELRADMHERFALHHASTVRWMAGLLVGQTAVILSILHLTG